MTAKLNSSFWTPDNSWKMQRQVTSPSRLAVKTYPMSLQSKIWNTCLKNTAHINKLTAMLISTLKKIAHIRYLLDQDTTKTLLQSLMMLKLDCCISIVADSTDYTINKLQRFQNTSCRVIFNLGKYDSITSHLAELHWLKIRDQITYKIAMLFFKCRMDAAPKYLIDLLDLTHNITLRFLSRNKLPVKTSILTQVLNSSFSCVWPKVWNNLTDSVTNCQTIEIFKKNLDSSVCLML